MSSFSSLNIGTQALSAAQQALEVVGQNVANANTDGYSRQRVTQVARGGSTVPAIWSVSDTSVGGVDVTGIERIRDSFLEARAQQEHGTLANLTAMSGTYGDLESTFGEPSETGLQNQLSTFWGSWHDIANNPGDGSAASVVLEQASTMASSLNGFATQLAGQWQATRGDIDSTVSQINTMAAQVAQLNGAIRSATLSGQSPNDLADQRDAIVLSLAEATGASATPGANGVVNVTLGGRPLVSDDHSQQLQALGPTTYPSATGTVSIAWAGTGQPATVSSGTLAGQLTAVNATIPGTMTDLDAVAAQLASTVNAQQAAGYDGNGNPGSPMFTGTTAATIAVSLTDPSSVATSSAAPPAFDGANAAAMAAHATDAAGPDALFQQMMGRLGVQSQTIQQHTTTQQSVVGQVDDSRQSVSGVNIDEEMTNLIAYQHAYSAAAQYISVISSTLDTLMTMTR